MKTELDNIRKWYSERINKPVDCFDFYDSFVCKVAYEYACDNSIEEVEIKDFNAEQAKKVVDSLFAHELQEILVDIKREAEKGESVLPIYKKIKPDTWLGLTGRGFRVVDQSLISIQKDSLYHLIHWD